MKNEEYLKWSERAREFGVTVARDDEVVVEHRERFIVRRMG
jgi:hypothetical protein